MMRPSRFDRYLFRLFVVSAWLLAGCQSAEQQRQTNTTDSTASESATVQPPAPDSLMLDLAKLKATGAFTNPQTIRVADDPVFHGPKTYRALSLRTLLEKHTALKSLDPA